tara:strand:+ start:527 stop:1123 length:597 start_codon:yes stop_codon:yes gene_type:complete
MFKNKVPVELVSLDKDKKNSVVLIWFYAVWCGHCKTMENDWEQLNNKHPSGLKLVKIESNDMGNYNKSPGEEDIRGYPTLRLYSNNLIKEYDGDRSYGEIYKFANEYMKKHNNVKKNNLLIIEAQKKNKINKRLIKSIIKHKKNTKKSKKTTVKNNMKGKSLRNTISNVIRKVISKKRKTNTRKKQKQKRKQKKKKKN